MYYDYLEYEIVSTGRLSPFHKKDAIFVNFVKGIRILVDISFQR